MLMTSLNLVACKVQPDSGITSTIGSTSSSVGTNQNPSLPGTSDFNTPPTLAPGETALYDLRTDDLWEPIGIDNAAPRFSWKMASAVIGQKQTAYRITVSDENGTAVWDSGKVESGDSVDISYTGNKLTSSTTYTWKVTVWDKLGLTVESLSATFETALLGKEPFSDTEFVSYSDSSALTNTVYTVDFDFILDSGNFGICFGATDSNNLIMWQLNTVTAPGRILLRPHVKSGGKWSTPAGNIDVTAALGMSNSSELFGKLLHERIEVNGCTVKTYLGVNASSLTPVNTYTHSGNIPLNKLAFRMHSYENEVARFDNLVVKDEAGEILYSNDFSGEFSGFDDSGAGEIKDGMYLAGTTAGNAEHFMLQSSGNGYIPGYRKSFKLSKEVKSAKLYTCGLGVYESYINGQRVGRKLADDTISYQELKPGFTEESKRQYYSSFDVTRMLIAGSENVLSAIVTDGWWSGLVGGRYGKNNAYLAKMIITYTDGNQDVITTGTDWKTEPVSALIKADIFNGEFFDARVKNDWMLPGYDDSEWSNVVVNNEFNGTIQAWKGSYITVRDDLERKVQSVTVYDGAEGENGDQYGKIHVVRTAENGSFTLNPGETALIDFGQNASGWEFFTVEGKAGTVLTVEHGEIINDRNGEKSRGNDGPGGSIYNANYRSAAAITKYILNGEGKESYHPSFTFYGFRYIEITTTETVTFHAVSAQTVTSVEQDTGSMETGNEKIDQLFSNIRWGQYSNYLSVPTDCPQRDERQGWTADTQVFAETGCYLGFSKSFLEKSLQDMRDSQRADGSYPGTAPTGKYNGAKWNGVGWADAGIIVPYILYVHYGYLDAVEKCWTSMQKYMRLLQSRGKLGPEGRWGDWLAYEANDDEIKAILSVAYYAWDSLMMAEMAEALGKTDDATKYKALYETEKEYFIRQFVSANGGMKRTEQTACLYALYLDLLPDENSVEKVKSQLINNIKRNGNKLQTGFLGTKIILDTLTKIGETELAYTLLLQENDPSWLYSVLQGATTVWERWNSYTLNSGFGDVGMNSFNHYAYGAVAAWMYHTMAGINADSSNPGFKHMIIAPYPDARLGSVKASYDSIYGTISVDSQYSAGQWSYKLSIPANTSATVKLPTLSFSSITVNGKALSELKPDVDGIEYVSTENGVATFNIVAGSFEFVSK